jgi:hypothetical protein
MDFPNAITILISRPVTLGMTNPLQLTGDSMISPPVIGANLTRFDGRGLDVLIQGRLVRMVDDLQPDLTRGAPDCPDDGRTVILMDAMVSALVSPSSQWVIRAQRSLFFPAF